MSIQRRRSAVALLVLIAFSVPSTGGAAEKQGCFAVVNVDLWDVLFIRSQRDHRSKAVGAIAPDHIAPIRSTGPCHPRGASRRRQWCPVEYAPLPDVNIKGFVKAFFVRPTACN